MRLLLSLSLAMVAGCTSVDELRERPFAWTAVYPARYDEMANCLTVRMVQDYDVTPQFYVKDRRAVLTVASKGGSRMMFEYIVNQVSNTESEISFRRMETVFNNKSLTADSRALADRCAKGA